MSVHRLRVEDKAPEPQQPPTATAVSNDLEHWRRLAITNGERLQIAEMQAKDLRREADEGRARHSKVKQRLDSANERVNTLQVELTKVSAERDILRARVARQEEMKRLVYEYRQSLMNGPIWDLFAELCTVSADEAGGESKQS